MSRIIAVFAVLVLLPLLSLAQTPVPGVAATIEFSFYANGKSLPAGNYEYRLDTNTDVLKVTNTKTRETIMVPVITTISKKVPPDGEIVFDKTASEYYLTEVFIPGQDGLLVKGAGGKHTHVSVKAKK
ncbi:MAG: hypothetical protein LAP85_23620 [Acidobacteriia bacterium]|nr:hypothetical protein [Terriglobia bacterium]